MMKKKDVLKVLEEFPMVKVGLLKVAESRRRKNWEAKKELERMLDLKRNFGGVGFMSGQVNDLD